MRYTSRRILYFTINCAGLTEVLASSLSAGTILIKNAIVLASICLFYSVKVLLLVVECSMYLICYTKAPE